MDLVAVEAFSPARRQTFRPLSGQSRASSSRSEGGFLDSKSPRMYTTPPTRRFRVIHVCVTPLVGVWGKTPAAARRSQGGSLWHFYRCTASSGSSAGRPCTCGCTETAASGRRACARALEEPLRGAREQVAASIVKLVVHVQARGGSGRRLAACRSGVGLDSNDKSQFPPWRRRRARVVEVAAVLGLLPWPPSTR
jgi:hypothetical protein